MKDVDENGQEKGTIRSATAIYTSDGKTKLKEIEDGIKSLDKEKV